MGSILFAVTCGERYDNALDPDRRVVVAGRRKYVRQGLVGLRVVRHQSPACRVQDARFLEHHMTCRIGMHDVASRIDQEDASANSVERIGEGRCFGYHITDESRSLNVQGDKALACLEGPRLSKHIAPLRWIKRRIVDVADQCPESLRIVHSPLSWSKTAVARAAFPQKSRGLDDAADDSMR